MRPSLEHYRNLCPDEPDWVHEILADEADATEKSFSELRSENAALREIGWRLARALEAARTHGFHGGSALLVEWADFATKAEES